VSTPLLSRAHERLATAPPGLGAADTRVSEAPHGWIRVRSGRLSGLAHRADMATIQIVRAAAPAITRRRFLRRAGGVIFVGSLSLSRLVGRSEAADPHETDCGPLSAGCGSSPLCSSGHCKANGECDTSDGKVRRRVNDFHQWAGFNCGADDDQNCWTECCGPPSDCNLKRCCDCCTPSTDPPMCDGCANDRHACICRTIIGTCVSSECQDN
jgi:hypothetical protein